MQYKYLLIIGSSIVWRFIGITKYRKTRPSGLFSTWGILLQFFIILVLNTIPYYINNLFIFSNYNIKL